MRLKFKISWRTVWCGFVGHKWEASDFYATTDDPDWNNARFSLKTCERCGVKRYEIPLGQLVTVTARKRAEKTREAISDKHPLLEAMRRGGMTTTIRGGKTVDENSTNDS